MTESAHPSATEPATSFDWYETALLVLVASLAFFLASNTVADPDIFGHLKFGQDIWNTGSIVQQDRYSYMTQGQTWINHEWLAEVLFARSYTFFGNTGLNILKLSIILPLVIGLYVSIAGRAKDSTKACLLIVSSLPLLKIGTQVVRPHLFTYLFLGTTLFVLDKLQEGKYRWLLLLPPIYILWANTHGGFAAGLTIILIWAGANLFNLLRDGTMSGKAKLTRGLVIAFAFVGSLVCTLINPYGFGLLSFLFKTVTVARPDITEWDPVVPASWAGLYYAFFVALTGAILLFSRQKPKLPDILLWVALAIGPLSAYRHLPLMAVGCCFISGKYIAGFPPSGINLSALARKSTAVYATLSTVAAIVFFALGISQFDKLRISASDFPIGAVKLLKERHAKGNLACFFDWGEYVIWELGPQVKVCMDGRRETVYSSQTRQDYASFLHGDENWDKIVDNNGTNMVLVSKAQLTSELMQRKPGWALVYEDKLCRLFCKRGDPHFESK